MKRKGLNFMNRAAYKCGRRMRLRQWYKINREIHPTTAHVGTNLEPSIWPKGEGLTRNITYYEYVSKSGLGQLKG